MTHDKSPIFITGASGYVGGRLIPLLLQSGYAVRCLRASHENSKSGHGAPTPTSTSSPATCPMWTSSPPSSRDAVPPIISFIPWNPPAAATPRRDQQLASNFAQAAARAGLPRIIYLGGLGEMGAGLSQHLRSRREVEASLASTGVPLTTLRAAMIIGAGSASFEILRYLVERLPMMLTPSWVKTLSQPVAIDDVLHWLVRCLSVPETAGQTLEIGGPDVLSYRDLMQLMAQELHLPKRIVVALPFLTPKLSSLWISLVTPVSYRIAGPLSEGMRNRVVVTNLQAQRLMPHHAIGVREAIRQAVKQIQANDVETRWSAAGPIPGDPQWSGGTVFTDERSILISADKRSVFAAVCRIGGGNGWYAGDLLWRLRGWMDTLLGGPGLRRGRRNAEHVEFGEALDFWRVVGIDRDHTLSLLAEMKLPGIAMLNFNLESTADGKTILKMIARFQPRGLLGLAYWYTVLPLHNLVFGGMLKGIQTAAQVDHRQVALSPMAR